MTKRQLKLGQNDIDIETIDETHLNSTAEIIGKLNPNLHAQLDEIFDCDTHMSNEKEEIASNYSVEKYFIEAKIEADDSFAVLARRNVEYFREKFDQLLKMS